MKSGAPLDSERRKEEARNILGKFIIQAALQGERDMRRLREGALLNYAKSKCEKDEELALSVVYGTPLLPASVNSRAK